MLSFLYVLNFFLMAIMLFSNEDGSIYWAATYYIVGSLYLIAELATDKLKREK